MTIPFTFHTSCPDSKLLRIMLLTLMLPLFVACGGGAQQKNINTHRINGEPEATQALQKDLLELFIEAGSLEAASPMAQKFYQAQKDQPDACFYMGVILREKGVYEQAEKYFLESLKLDSEYARSYDALGILHGVQGQQAKALKYHRKAVELQADNPKFWHNYGFALSINQQLDEAIAAFQKTLSLAPNSSKTFISLAFVYAAKDLFKEAERYLTQVLPPAQVQYNLGLIYEKKKNIEAAEKHYQKALKLNMNLKLAQDALKRLKSQKRDI